MILREALRRPIVNTDEKVMTLPEMVDPFGYGMTQSAEPVSVENSKTISSAYRAGNIISDDVAKMPLQAFQRTPDSKIEHLDPDPRTLNLAYLLEISPNQWGWTPFLFKKAVIQWMIFWGNSYIWKPPTWPPQLLIMPANMTWPVLAPADGSIWYQTQLNYNAPISYIPGVEVLHLMINPDRFGFWGRGVITYARETLGRQLGAYRTQARMYAQGLNMAGYVSVTGQLDKEGREAIRTAYSESISGANNSARLAVFDSRVTHFEPVTMKPTDAQFLESIAATDRDIANFFGLPEYKLNSGKQAYNSNEAQNLDYLSTTLDPYLVQWEQGARVKWLPTAQQANTQVKFIRESLLRTDALTRATYNEILIRSGQRSPNEAREKDDYSSYPGGDQFHMSANYPGVGAAAAAGTAKQGGQ